MLTLGIETSGKNGTVALLDGATVLEQQFLGEGKRPETRKLPVCVQQILANNGRKPDQLDCLAVSRGPGSFTGLRVGIVFAKLFGYTTGVPLVAVDTFAATVENLIPVKHLPEGEKIEIVEDLRKGQIAWQRFTFEEKQWQPEGEIAVVELDEWANFTRENVTLSGAGVERILKQVAKKNPECSFKILPEQLRFPDAIAVALLGQKKISQVGSVDPLELKPVYIRRSAAEEKSAL